MLRILGLMAGLLLAGCGGAEGDANSGSTATPVCSGGSAGAAGSGSSAPPVCESGRSVTCACPDGSMSSQACESDGSGWGECQCKKPAAAADISEVCAEQKLDQSKHPLEERCPAHFDLYGMCDKRVSDGRPCFSPNNLFVFYCCYDG